MADLEGSDNSPLETVLITGGCGFIGTNLVKYLAGRGYQIRVLEAREQDKKSTRG